MSTFTIDAGNNITALPGLPAGADESQSFSTPKELGKLTAEWPVSRLVETWNSFAGVAPFDELKPVKKFTSRKVELENREAYDLSRGTAWWRGHGSTQFSILPPEPRGSPASS